MAKGLFCLECSHWEQFDVNGGVTRCKCPVGPVVGWWIDFQTAQVQMAVLPPGDRSKARVLAIESPFLRADVDTIPAGYIDQNGKAQPFNATQMDELWRDVHNQAVLLPVRPEALSVFSPGRRNCVIVVQIPGTTPDTFWATDPELVRRGLLS